MLAIGKIIALLIVFTRKHFLDRNIDMSDHINNDNTHHVYLLLIARCVFPLNIKTNIKATVGIHVSTIGNDVYSDG